ncbi:MAG: hypothetical protein KDI48_01290 [Xanthomonadales bacterium]|nr:hypothetical protein [Xanthomonadales bacterium]
MSRTWAWLALLLLTWQCLSPWSLSAASLDVDRRALTWALAMGLLFAPATWRAPGRLVDALAANQRWRAFIWALLLAALLVEWLAAALALQPLPAWIGASERGLGLVDGLAWGVVVLGLLGRRELDSEAYAHLQTGLLLLGAALALVLLFELLPGAWVGDWQRSAGPMGNASYSGSVLAPLLVLAFAHWRQCRRRGGEERFSRALFYLLLAGLISTGSRAALLAAALGALLWLLHQVPKRRSLLGWVALAGGLLVVLVMLLSWRPASVQIRSELWQAAWAGVHTKTPLPRWDGGSDGLAGARPWIGYGQDNLEPALTLVRAPVLNSLQARGFDTLADRSHNALLDRWLSNGLLGALPGLLLWGLLARSVWRKLDGPGSALAAAWFAAWADRAFGVPSPGADLLLALITSGCLWVVRSDTPSPVRTRPFILLALLPLLGLLALLLSGLHHWVWHAPRSPALPTASHWPCGNDAPRAAQRIALSQQPYSVLPWLRLDEAALAACASVPGLAEHLTAAAPSLPRAWLWRARLEMAAGDSVSAQQSLLQAQRLLPAHDAAARLSAYAQAGAVKADDPTSALAALDALWALGPAPEDLAWWRTLGYLQAVAGQRQAAIEAYRLALQQNPADGASRRNLARLQASSQE